MTAALRPGGWLLLEEFDHLTFLPDSASSAADQAVWAAWLTAFERLAAKRGLDLIYGRRLFRLLNAQGLTNLHAEGRSLVERSGSAKRDLLRLSVISLRNDLVATGAIDQAGVDSLVALLDDPRFSWTSQLMVTARGRRPS